MYNMVVEVRNMEKYCSKCQNTKGRMEFYPDKSRGDNCSTYCRECMKLLAKTSKFKEGRRKRDALHVRGYGRFAHSKRQAKTNKHEWQLSREQYTLLISKMCEYCGFELPETGIGLDRMDSRQGYTLDNVVPCCAVCNKAKSNYFTYTEMREVGKIIRNIKQTRLESSLQSFLNSK